ncbi:5-formyltetrahydrofolate cyclo-ligase [Roseivirga sp.]|uniref:5-formyltetrahydrofolate cyclo-ligase n=1 Tax=Roseivirga sp. TaxID=1964215 RepID=UPI003B8EA984
MNKEVLRSLYLEKRQTLTSKEFERRNSLLFQHVTNFLKHHQDLTNCHLFLSIEKFQEPNTWPILDWLIKSQDHSAFASKTNFKEKLLSHYEVNTDTEIATSKFGIPEPVDAQEIESKILDVVFIPLISFDLTGNRIGFGAGIYDRFLTKLPSKTKKIGLAITPPLDNIDYNNALDIPLDACISHLGIDHFNVK